MSSRFPTKAFVAAMFGTLIVGPTAVIASEFEAERGWSGHLFPSFIIATATVKVPEDSDGEETDDDSDAVLGDPKGLLGITVEADEDDQEVTVTIECDTIMEASTITCTLPKSGTTYTINPKIKYKYEELAKRSQTGPITVSYSVEFGDDDAEEKTETLTLRSVNDCPYSLLKDGKWQSVRYMFAAYVNEQHPFVDKVLREALDTKIVDSFTGYQTNSQTEVYRQAYAVWHALSQRDVRYSNITKTVGLSDSVGSQHVRMIEESINNGQANCLDGSVLLASLLRKIDIEPLLVHVPGHCYLAFFLDAEGKQLTAIETTMIGSLIEGDAIAVNGLEEVVGEDSQSKNSWKTFAAAISRGTANFKKFQMNFDDPNDQSYKLISVGAARKSGILPIGFQSNHKFVGAPDKSDSDDDVSNPEE